MSSELHASARYISALQSTVCASGNSGDALFESSFTTEPAALGWLALALTYQRFLQQRFSSI